MDDLRSSTFSSQRSGYMMFSDFAQRIGADLRVLGRPFNDETVQLDRAAQVWTIGQEEAGENLFRTVDEESGEPKETVIGEGEAIELEYWIMEGGTLVVAPHYDYYEISEPLLKKAGYGVDKISVIVDEKETTRYPLRPKSEHELLDGVNEVSSYLYYPEEGGGIIFRLSSRGREGQVLLGDEYGAAAVVLKLGKGEVILLADQYIFSNFLLPEADNAQFAANILAKAGGLPVYFDEYHHGYVGKRGLSDVLVTKAGRGLLFLFAVAVIGVYAAGRRFGLALPAPPAGKRSPAEYVISMGLLFRRAEATGLALDVLERDFANFLQKRFRLRTLDPAEVKAQLKLMGYEKYKEITAILEEFERLRGDTKPHARRLLRLSQRIEPLKGAH